MNPRATLDDPNLSVSELLRIDEACDRFEADWRDGRVPNLAAYLSEAPEEVRAPLFRNLLSLELEYRRRAGQRPEPRWYHERFPDHVEGVDVAFRAKDTQLRSAGDASSGDWRRGSAGVGGSVTTAPQAWFGAGGPDGLSAAGYDVLDELGRGGMGVVYKALQVALNRNVALKLIKSGSIASEAELLRFQNEAEAVAQLDHPHIIPIYEVGRHRGQAFFSMKLIAGTSLDKRLADYTNDFGGAARLVAVAAEAVHHAHQRGILHRDLKPANILVDEQGEPHVTDFGLAKRIDAEADLTHSGTLMGTPSYMAPEQASQSRGGLSTATDVYGLGTIFYALLTGRAPFAGTTLVQTLDLVRTQPPESPTKVNRKVPRDLEIICMKCLEKEPQRRYPSALVLAEDLNRWRAGEPIVARPVGPVVRAGMWCRRNPVLTALAASLVLALVAGFAGITWKWREATRHRLTSEAVNELLTRRLLAQASPEFDFLDKNPTVRELIDRASDQLGIFQGQPEIEAKLRETIGGAYLELGQHDRADKHLRAAIRLNTELYGPKDRDTLRTTNLLATLLDRTGAGVLAEPMLRRNLDDCRGSLGPDDPVTLDAAERLGSVLWHLGKKDEAATLLRKNVDDRKRVLLPDHPDTLRSIFLLSRLLQERNEFGDAEKFANEYEHSVRCTRGPNHPDVVLAISNQGDVCRARGQLDRAERYFRQAAAEAGRIHGPEHPSTLAAQTRLVQQLGDMGRHP